MKIKYRAILMSIIFAVVLLIGSMQMVGAIPASTDKLYKGIDVSKWQGNIDFNRVKDDGVQIVYMRAGQGSSYKDPFFEQNYRKARQAGFKIGFYHFVTATNVTQAKEQARFFVSIIGNRISDCLLIGDFERAEGISKQAFNQLARAFLETVQALTGVCAGVYTSSAGARDSFSKEVSSRFPLWVAEYGVNEPKANGNWDTWAGWQYSNTGRVSGISGNVDLDRFSSAMFLDKSNLPKPSPEEQEVVSYRVVLGDTLIKIAKRFQTTVQSIVSLNGIQNPNLIFVGEILKIRPSNYTGGQGSETRYIVKKGDTLLKIAQRFQTTAGRLERLNRLENPNLIFIGQGLIVPK